MAGAKWENIGYIIGSLLYKKIKYGLTAMSIQSFIHQNNVY